MKLIGVLVFCGLLGNICAVKIILDKFNATINPAYAAAKMTITDIGTENARIDQDIDVVKEVANELIYKMELYHWADEKFQYLFGTDNLDICKMNGQGTKEEKFVKFFMDEISKYGNISYTCPIKTGHYQMRGFQIDKQWATIHNAPPGKYKIDSHFSHHEPGHKDMAPISQLEIVLTIQA
jgi:hypothetical protein